jgi:4-amino-4-deoxy-L-arabinose transferase-like glycosyltransferase
MKKNNTGIILLFVITLLAAVLRLVNVPSIPPSLSWDEVSLGYNAYSILETGRDEHGKFLPISTFEAYGDYKPPGYIYATVPSIALFDLTEFAVRLPSILAGIISVVLTYYIVRELFTKESNAYKELIALLAAFLLAVSPWHLNISRVAYEANLAHMFILFGILLFLKAINGKPRMLLPSGIFFVLSLYTFNSARIFIPLFLLFSVVLFGKSLLTMKKWAIIAAVISSLLILPLMPHLLSSEGKLRFQEVNIFSDSKPVEMANKRIEASGNSWWANIIQNRRVQFVQEMAKHYFDNLSPNFLFINGDGNPKFSIRDVGQLYIVEIPFLVFGFYLLIKRGGSTWKFLVLWLIAGIMPASIARETPHALRTLNTLTVWQIAISLGIVGFFVIEKEGKFAIRRKVLAGFTILAFTFNIAFYLYTYHVSYPKEFASERQYGYREALVYVDTVKDRYDKIWITDSIGRPYMYTLFYTKFDPSIYQQEVVRTSDAYGFFTVHSFGKYIFDLLPADVNEKRLYVSEPNKRPEGSTLLKTIFYPNGLEALVIYE